MVERGSATTQESEDFHFESTNQDTTFGGLPMLAVRRHSVRPEVYIYDMDFRGYNLQAMSAHHSAPVACAYKQNDSWEVRRFGFLLLSLLC